MSHEARGTQGHGRLSGLLAAAGVVAIASALIGSVLSLLEPGRGGVGGTLATGPGKGSLLPDDELVPPTEAVAATASPRTAIVAGSPTATPRTSPTSSPAAAVATAHSMPEPSSSADAAAPAASSLPDRIVPPRRAKTHPAAVPAALLKRLGSAPARMPHPYRNGCHGGSPWNTDCFFGHRRSRTTIVLFGDSHALSWFPAIEEVADKRGWRLLNLTYSACVPAWIISFDPRAQQVMRACLSWRARAIERLAELRPDIVLVSGTRGLRMVDASGQELTGQGRIRAWTRGMTITLTKLARTSDRVILVADTPNSGFSSPATCLARNPENHVRCATAVHPAINYDWLNAELAAAKATKSGFINAERWVCPTSPCPEVINGRLVHRNGGHLSFEFAAAQAGRFERAILEQLGPIPPGS
jgi:hypothetical protein